MSLHDSYYDPFPIVSLGSPMAISGMIPTELRQLAHRVASLHGLRFTDFDAALEHEAGRSLAQLRDDEAEASVRRLERRVAARLLADQPWGIVALPDRLLSMRSIKRLVEKKSTFVALDYEVRDCYRRFTQAYRSEAPRWVLEAPGPGSLGPLYRQWTRRFAKAHIQISMDGATWRDASESLIRELEASNWR